MIRFSSQWTINKLPYMNHSTFHVCCWTKLCFLSVISCFRALFVWKWTHFKNFLTWALIYAQLGSNNIIYCATWVAVEMVWSIRILRSKMSDKEKSNSQGDYTVNNVIIYHYCLGSIHLITFIEMIIYYVHAEFWTLSFKWKFMNSSLNLHSLFLYCMR